ncbi:MAG: hypothetical protein WC401_10880 [Bacteroidales bacterium]|jgi:calcineurin-like phosphoesterase family protein
MNAVLMANHNAVVTNNDFVYHLGDFAMGVSHGIAIDLIRSLNGVHFFIMGSHDRWLDRLVKGSDYNEGQYSGVVNYRGRRFEITIKNNSISMDRYCQNFISMDHYCQRVWAKSHYNSWHIFGHSHGKLDPIGKSWDVGVDNNNYYPISFDQLTKIMAGRPDNPNLIKKER